MAKLHLGHLYHFPSQLQHHRMKEVNRLALDHLDHLQQLMIVRVLFDRAIWPEVMFDRFSFRFQGQSWTLRSNWHLPRGDGCWCQRERCTSGTSWNALKRPRGQGVHLTGHLNHLVSFHHQQHRLLGHSLFDHRWKSQMSGAFEELFSEGQLMHLPGDWRMKSQLAVYRMRMLQLALHLMLLMIDQMTCEMYRKWDEKYGDQRRMKKPDDLHTWTRTRTK